MECIICERVIQGPSKRKSVVDDMIAHLYDDHGEVYRRVDKVVCGFNFKK